MELNIAYTTNDAYAKCTGISILSLFHNNQDATSINVYVFITDMSEVNQKRIMKIAMRYKRNIEIIDINTKLNKLASELGFEKMRGSYNTYVKLFVSHWIESVDKVLFIDADTLVVGSVSNYFNEELGNNIIAAVPDAGIYDKISEVESDELINIGKKYFNAGVMLLNLKLWREENLDSYISKKIKEYNGEWYNAEQSMLNYAFYDRCKYVHLRYNYYTPFHFQDYDKVSKYLDVKRAVSKMEYIEAKKAPAIIHFLGLPYVRPWYSKNLSPYKTIYMKYYKISPWGKTRLDDFPKNPQLSYRIYDYILFIAQKHKLYSLHNLIRSTFSGKIKSIIKQIVGTRK